MSAHKTIDWMRVESEAAAMQDRPDCLPTNVREWTAFIEQYESFVAAGKSQNVPYKRSISEVAMDSYSLVGNRNSITNYLKRRSSKVTVDAKPNEVGLWLESHGIFLKPLFLARALFSTRFLESVSTDAET